MLALLAGILAFAARPRARLKVVARGFNALDSLERHVLEYSRALSSVLKERCATDEGCLVVEVEWKAPRYLNDSALEMRLQIINANESFD